MKKIIGNTVGMGLPKPNLKQNDPSKGDFVYGKSEITNIVNDALAQAKASGEFNGEKGDKGDPGNDYVLTDADMAAIAGLVDVPEAVTDEHINSLIDAKLGVIENGTY